jgi:asparaginyl-tRNA synthetase
MSSPEAAPLDLPVATVDRLSAFAGKRVRLNGWVFNKSSKGKLHFVHLRDGTGVVQCVVFHKNVSPELFEAVGHLGQESSLSLTGLVKEDARAPGGFEIDVDGGRVWHAVEGYPITPMEHGADFLLSHRHLW